MDELLYCSNAIKWKDVDLKTAPRPTLLFEFVQDFSEKDHIIDLFHKVIVETFSNLVMRNVMLADVEQHVSKFIQVLLGISIHERAIVVSQFTEFEATWFVRVLKLFLESLDIVDAMPVKVQADWLIGLTLEQYSILYCKSLAFVVCKSRSFE